MSSVERQPTVATTPAIDGLARPWTADHGPFKSRTQDPLTSRRLHISSPEIRKHKFPSCRRVLFSLGDILSAAISVKQLAMYLPVKFFVLSERSEADFQFSFQYSVFIYKSDKKYVLI